MNTEQKAKAYDEALKRAKNLENTTTEEDSLINYIFPELKDSEDERVRSAMIRGFNSMLANQAIGTFAGEPIKNILSYIEKQKEHGIQNTDALEKWLKENVSRFINREFNEFHRQLEYDGTINIDALISDMRKQDFYTERRPIEDIVKDITKDRETAIVFLKNAGIMDESGELTEKYRTEEKKEQKPLVMAKYIDAKKAVEVLKKINVLMKIQHRSYLSNELERIISFIETSTKNE